MGLLDKFKKNKKDSVAQYQSHYAISAYEVVHISSYGMYDLLDDSPLGVVGTARLIQRVTNIIFMVSVELDDIDWDIATRFGFRKLDTKSDEVDDVYFICASIAALYQYIFYMMKYRIANNAATVFSSWLKYMDSAIFTYSQYYAMGWTDFHVGLDSFPQLITRGDELMELIDHSSLNLVELDIMILKNDNSTPDERTIMMSFAEYSMCIGDGVIVFIYPEQYLVARNIVNISNAVNLKGDMENPAEEPDWEDDMTACEIIDDIEVKQ
jgi:hypothetical protein